MRNDEARTQCYCVPGLVVLRAHDGSVAVVLVKQTRHVAFFHEAPAEGRLCAVNFSAETPAPRISSVVPTVVTERPFLR